MDWKNQYCENDYTTQSNLQIQSNPYQATNGIFHRTRTNNFTICMEIQKPQIAKVILRKKNGTEIAKVILRKKNGTCLTSGSTTKPQSSRQYGIGIKIDI